MDVNQIQRLVLTVINDWVKTHKTPIAQHMIVTTIASSHDIPDSTIKAATRVLCSKGYIRKAVTVSQTASYVQLRSL